MLRDVKLLVDLLRTRGVERELDPVGTNPDFAPTNRAVEFAPALPDDGLQIVHLERCSTLTHLFDSPQGGNDVEGRQLPQLIQATGTRGTTWYASNRTSIVQ